ncbi:MAG: GNAT family N-acetyltransferase [Sandaracinaceae bacterium]|nr:GNAT family N-acetyltransferase [Sandaracinaceae bacterium]
MEDTPPDATAPLAPLSPTPRTTLHRRAMRAVSDRQTLYDLLDDCVIVQVASPAPVVLPMAFGRIDDTLYLHGAIGNALLRGARAEDVEVCVSATRVDGIVLARSAFHHSMNYRSAVVFGRLREVDTEDEKRAALDAVVNHALPGRSAECRPATPEELRVTRVVALSLAEASVKLRATGPVDDDSDLPLPHWAGVLPLVERSLRAEPDATHPLADAAPPPSVVAARLARAPRLTPFVGHDQVRFSGDARELDLPRLLGWLRDESYWAKDLTPDLLVRAVLGSLTVAAYTPEGAMVAFGRVVTDGATFAWLADVFVAQPFRGRGIGRALVRNLVDHPELAGLRRVMLGTRDAHALYASMGFEPPPDGILMQRVQRAR